MPQERQDPSFRMPQRRPQRKLGGIQEYFDVNNLPTETCDHHTSGGTIIVPPADAGKYTDDTWTPPPVVVPEETQPDEGDTGEITDAPSEGPAIYLPPGVQIGPQVGPGGA